MDDGQRLKAGYVSITFFVGEECWDGVGPPLGYCSQTHPYNAQNDK